jgi:hypothetical protein
VGEQFISINQSINLFYLTLVTYITILPADNLIYTTLLCSGYISFIS